MINFDIVYMLQLNMAGVGPSGSDIQQSENNDPTNITGNEIFDHDMDDTGNDRVDHELEPLK